MSGEIQNKKTLKGVRRFIRGLEDFVDSNSFQAQIIKLRAQYTIPVNGFPLTDEKQIEILSPFNFPSKWRFKKDKLICKKINCDIGKISEEFPFRGLFLNTILRGYLFYNHLSTNLMGGELLVQNLCKITDEHEEVSEYAGVDNIYFDHMENETKVYPIAIRISPYASFRTIEEYIKKTYSGLIEPLQKKYRGPESKLGKTRIRNKYLSKRNKKIYELRHLPHKEIARIVNEEFFGKNILVGYEEISGIIAIEKERRK